MHRFFTPPDQFPVITGADAHQVKDVLRMKAGEHLELFTGDGQVHEAKIIGLAKDRIDCEIIFSTAAESEPKTKITLAQGLPKGRKMDLIVEKCVELGVRQIIPMLTERTVAKETKPLRWRKIAKEAAEQSKRALIPEIKPLTKFEDVLSLKAEFDLAIIPWELEQKTTLKQALTPHCSLLPAPSSILLLIGPEGGFSEAEIAAAKKAGFISVSLGPRILRTETAGLAALAAITYELG
jgi:16S rRNA (uracil1498-N3)-methyltransferase